MTVDELRRARSQGHFIVSNGTRFQLIDDRSLDDDSVTDEEVEPYIKENKRRMVEDGVTSRAGFFTYDGKNAGDRALGLIEEYHAWGRAANARLNASLTYPLRKSAANIDGHFNHTGRSWTTRSRRIELHTSTGTSEMSLETSFTRSSPTSGKN